MVPIRTVQYITAPTWHSIFHHDLIGLGFHSFSIWHYSGSRRTHDRPRFWAKLKAMYLMRQCYGYGI